MNDQTVLSAGCNVFTQKPESVASAAVRCVLSHVLSVSNIGLPVPSQKPVSVVLMPPKSLSQASLSAATATPIATIGKTTGASASAVVAAAAAAPTAHAPNA